MSRPSMGVCSNSVSSLVVAPSSSSSEVSPFSKRSKTFLRSLSDVTVSESTSKLLIR